MWEESLDMYDDYSWVTKAMSMQEDHLNNRQLYYDKVGKQIAVVDNYKLAKFTEKPVAKWTDMTEEVEPAAITLMYNAQKRCNSMFNEVIETINKKYVPEPVPEPVILVYQSEPIPGFGTVLELYGTNPEYKKWVEKQIENYVEGE